MSFLEIIFLFMWLVFIVSRIRSKTKEEYIIQSTKPVPVKLEIYSNQVYVWNAESDEFISQSKDVQTAMQIALQRFPDKSFQIVAKQQVN